MSVFGGIIAGAQEAPAEAPAEEVPATEAPAEAAPAEEAPAEAAPEGEKRKGLSPAALREKMVMPDDLKKVYERVVVAGKKIMYSPQTHELMLKQLKSEGAIEKRLGEGIGGLMVLLFKQSNSNLPPTVLIPAGTELLSDAVDYLNESGEESVTDEQMADALLVMVGYLLTKFGVDPNKLGAMLNQFAAKQGA